MPAPTTTDEFLDLVRKSGVVEEKRLSAYLAKLRAAGPLPPEPGKFAGLLVRDGILTHFQAEQVAQGKWRRFTIGKYKVLERLGAGGMGSVYLCEHKLMRRRVAVKVLPTAKADDPSSLERFYREARAVAALDHPNIVRAYDIDQDDKLHFLVMEYVDGASLQEIIKKVGPMSVVRVAHYMYQSAMGLQHAHESAGLVHRDIKPGNILVDRTGVVKILDMGLARFFHDEEDILTKKYDENVLGTADYLAPEQALDSHGVDIRADIYSLGATFYFCLTGRTPFTEGTVAQKLIWHQTRQPKAIRQVRPEVPEGLAGLIEHMMSKDPAQRPQTPQQVADALEPFVQNPIAPPPEVEMPRLSPAALGLTGTEASAPGSAPTFSSGAPSSGQRKSWQVPITPGTKPAAKSPAPRPPAAGPPAPGPRPTRPNPPSPSARTTPVPATAAAPRATPTPTAPRAGPTPTAEEEHAPWEHLAPETDDLTAQGDTPPRQTRKAGPSSTRRRPVGKPDATRDRKRVLVVVAIVSAVILGGFAVALLWAWLRDPGPSAASNAAPVQRPPLRVGKGQRFASVQTAIRNAIPGDTVLVHGPDPLEEELLFDGKDERRKNLTIAAENGGTPLLWRAPKGKELVHLIALSGADGLRLRGFTLDGDNRCKRSVILMTGHCPGTTLEDLTVQGFTTTGVLLMNCDGEAARPVTFSHLSIKTTTADAAYEFDLTPQIEARPNRFLSFIDCPPPEGTFKMRIRNPEKAREDVKGLPQ